MIRRVAVGLALCLLLAGCFANPKTSASFNPLTGQFKFSDSKDNSVMLKGLSYDDSSKTFNLEELSVSNMASPVMIANAEQMRAFTEIQAKVNEGIALSFAGLSNLTAQVMSGYSALAQALPAIHAQGTITGVGDGSVSVVPSPCATATATTQPCTGGSN